MKKVPDLALVCALLAALGIAACAGGGHAPPPAGTVEWGYDGAGAPGNWASLSEEYALCTEGQRQSPINITGYQEADSEPIVFLYDGNATGVRNDGRFVYVDYPPGNIFRSDQWTFELKSVHLHSPSEHRIDGMSFAAELHLVHEDDAGQLAVVALLFGLGDASPIVQTMLDAAPGPGDTVGGVTGLNARDFVPGEFGYYQYEGSKTTPPCDELVAWYVMRKPRTISPDQADKLLALTGGPNNRPVQPANGRVIMRVGPP